MSRYVDYKKRIRRTPWGFYLTLVLICLAALALGLFLGSRITADAKDVPELDIAPAPVRVTCRTDAKAVAFVPEIAEPVVVEPPYTDEELELLALVIYQEAGGDACSDETRQMVGEVALNRVASSIYPDTLVEVLTQPYQYGRLAWTGLVWPARADLPQEAHAVARAYETAEALLAGSVERLLPEDAIFQAEFPQGTETLVEIDGFYFCR